MIGSASVVTKDIPAYGIAAGTPAVVKKFRFPKAIIEHLQRIAWWEWEYEVIKERLGHFRDLYTFLSVYG